MTVKQMLGMGITAVPGKPPVPWTWTSRPRPRSANGIGRAPFLLIGDEGLCLYPAKGKPPIGPSLKTFHYWEIESKVMDDLPSMANAILDYADSRRRAAAGGATEEGEQGSAASGGASGGAASGGATGGAASGGATDIPPTTDVNVVVVWSGINNLFKQGEYGGWDTIAYPIDPTAMGRFSHTGVSAV